MVQLSSVLSHSLLGEVERAHTASRGGTTSRLDTILMTATITPRLRNASALESKHN